MQIHQENLFGDVLDRRNLYRQQKYGFKKTQIGIFPIHDFAKKVEVFNVLCLSKIDGEKPFPDVLDRKQVSEDYKNIGI